MISLVIFKFLQMLPRQANRRQAGQTIVARLAFALFMLAASTWPLWASEIAPQLRSLLENFAAHRRLATGYLRTGNPDLAAIEIERLRTRWAKDRSALPGDLVRNQSLAAALTETEGIISRSLTALDAGNAEEAHALVEGSALPLRLWREANGIRVFADCIADAGAAYARLDRHRTRAPNLTDPAAAEDVLNAAAVAAAAFRRCDAEASLETRKEAEFRRLLDGILQSLQQVPDAVRERDGAQLHRLLIEQRAFERLLAFRFG
jgi:hypothetical protein